jgi:hypothetical protein
MRVTNAITDVKVRVLASRLVVFCLLDSHAPDLWRNGGMDAQVRNYCL